MKKSLKNAIPVAAIMLSACSGFESKGLPNETIFESTSPEDSITISTLESETSLQIRVTCSPNCSKISPEDIFRARTKAVSLAKGKGVVDCDWVPMVNYTKAVSVTQANDLFCEKK